jgi:hypothetical protein
MKKALIGVAVVVLLVMVAAVWLLGSLDKIVKNQIEVIGTELTGVPVKVGSVGIDIKNGAGQIRRLRIDNPDGYAAANAFDMSLLRLDIDLTSLGKQPLVLDELIIDSAVVNMEINQQGRSNLKEILDNVSKNGQQADAKAETGDSGKPMRIAIRKLRIEGVTFTESNPLEQGEPRSGTLPTIEKANVGGSDGETPAGIGKLIIGELGGQIIKQAAKKKMTDVIEEKTGGILEGIGGALRKE